jgi:hypothetical protein
MVGTGRWHTYSLDGERVPSVTTIIGKATGKPGLVKWAAREAALWAAAHVDELAVLGDQSWTREAAAASDRVRDASAKAGSQLHLIAERLVFGDPVPDEDTDGLPFPDDVRRMGEQVARFHDAWDVAPVLVECPVFHEGDRWAGTLDLVADMADGARWIIDYKTGQSGVWAETALQVAAYRNATHCQLGDRDLLMSPTDKAGALWVRPDGWELVPLVADADTYAVFRHAMAVAAWASQSRDSIVGAALPLPGDAA